MIRPLYDRVIVKRSDEVRTQTTGGLYIPDGVQEAPQEGIVIAVGQGKYENGVLRDLTVHEGDKVLFGKYAGSKVELDGKEFLIMREDEILGIIE